MEEIVRRAPFPLYGLAPEWTGDRGLHSAGVSLGEVTHVALRHGAGTGPVDETVLVVDTLYGEERAPGDAVFHAALHLDIRDLGVRDQAHGSGDRGEWRWRPASFPVEGRDHVFWFHEEGERWAAFARVGGVRVVLAATRWDRGDVRLAVVEGEAYVGGAGSTTSR